jgi:F0F1-type ATP synthase membrane subunit b/b'
MRRFVSHSIVAALALVALGGRAASADVPPGPPPSQHDAPVPAPAPTPAPAPVAAAEAEAGHAEAGHAEAAEGPEDETKLFNFSDLGYAHKDVVGGPLDDGKLGGAPLAGRTEEKMPAPFLLLLGNFVLLLILLAWKAGPKVRKSAEGRSDEIKAALDEAAKLRDAAKAKLDEYETKLAAAEKDISAMVEGMRADALADKQRIIANAEAQAVALKKDADERIAAEIQRARVALAREVAAASTMAAEKLIRDKATTADQGRLVDLFITDIGKAPTAKETR